MTLLPKGETTASQQISDSGVPQSVLFISNRSAEMSRRQVVLNLNSNGAPVHPGLFRIPKDVEIIVRIEPNRNMFQVACINAAAAVCFKGACASAISLSLSLTRI